MIVLDTSFLIPGLRGDPRCRRPLMDAIRERQRMAIPAIVLYEWLRGRPTAAELEAQEALFPSDRALAFGPAEAAAAARLYRHLARARGREMDIAIAAHGLVLGAEIWTLNRQDFEDLPGVRLRRWQEGSG